MKYFKLSVFTLIALGLCTLPLKYEVPSKANKSIGNYSK